MSFPNDRIRAAADNLARWHDVSVRAPGIATDRNHELWSADDGAPFIFLAAITLAPDPVKEQVAAVKRMAEERKAVAVCDSRARLELGRLGFRVLDAGRWFWRDPAPRDRPDSPELHVKGSMTPSLSGSSSL